MDSKPLVASQRLAIRHPFKIEILFSEKMNSIFCNLWIDRDERKALDLRLGDEHAIERIAVMIW